MSNLQRSKIETEKRYELYPLLDEIYYLLYNNYEEDYTFYIEKLGHILIMIESSIINLLKTSSNLSNYDKMILLSILKSLEEINGTVS